VISWVMDIEGRLDRLKSNLDRLVGAVGVLADQVKIVVRTVGETAAAQRRNDEAINVLIRRMDEWIGNSPRTSPPAS
jgi:hypothetical protein